MKTTLLLLQQMPHPHHDSWGWGGGYLTILFWVVLFGLVMLMIWYLFRRGRRPNGDATRESPRETLDRRYAEGKIDEAEYRRRKEDLQR